MVNHNGKTYFLFGDTFASEASAGSGGPDWRQNVMAYSTDFNPANGITFDGWITRANGTARQVIVPGNQPVTYIPTGAVSVGDKIYSWFMHVTDWSDWSLDYAGLAKWREGDSQFSIVPNYKFQNPSGGDYTWGQGTQGGNFGMVAASFRSPLENSGDEYLYIWGTPGGREGGVKLARVLPSQIESLSSYRYFDGLVNGVPQWTTSETNGDKIIQSGVGEMSVMYNESVGAWTLMYISGGSQPDFEIRQAPNPWGPWSSPVTVAQYSQAPGLYSPYMNPLYVEDGGKTLYFTMSLWDPYDVYLAKVTLDIDDRVHWISGAGAWTNSSKWTPSAPTAVDHAIVSNSGNVTFHTNASVRLLDVGSLTGSAGSISIRGGALQVAETVEIFGNGTISLESGVLSATTILNTRGGTFAFTAGTLAVDAFNGNLVNLGGTLAPDHSATSIAGDYTQFANAVLALDLGGTVLGSQYDALNVMGALSLDGKLIVSLADGFVPAGGDRFDVLDFASVSGAFSNITLPSLPSELSWNASSLYVTGELAVQIVGDFNNDGQVDGADLVQWDDDFDGDSDGADILAWQRNLGYVGGATAQLAPEPSAGTTSLLALAMLACTSVPFRTRRGATRTL
jgi:hypothetical protein